MSQKKTITVTLALWVVLTMVYYNFFSLLQSYNVRYLYNIPMYRTPTARRIGFTYGESDNFLIDTPGCSIPNYSKTLHLTEAKRQNLNCNKRAVFVQKSSDHEIVFRIERSKIQVAGHEFKCCYRFAKRSTEPGFEDSKIVYSQCMPFENGDKRELEEEVITVSCVLLSKNKNKLYNYEDAYLFLKKKTTEELNLQSKDNIMKENWNILILGLDTISRTRAYSSLPKTVKYFKDRQWLDYRGYHKVGSNTFPNVIATLTGMNASSAYRTFAGGMEKCKHRLIWNAFQEAGYVTAFGEDNLRLPDTFAPYKGFKFPPTDHYIRPFFLTGESQIGNYLCAKGKPSAQHLLEYAEQFIETYKNDSFFGHFWINSCSHNIGYLPMVCEDYLINFFEHLEKINILPNTFIFFISDHGIRFGDMRKPRESYYEERLPMLFMWIPPKFREAYPEEYYNLQQNQYRLTTPYDIHMTLWRLLKMTNRDIDVVPSEECPKCEGLIEEITPHRTCQEAHINAKWCSCHNLIPAKNDSAADYSLKLAVKYIQNKTLSVKTVPCTMCSPLKLKTVLRIDWYTSGNKTYYIVAFLLSPGDVGFEESIEHSGNEFNILPPTDAITAYNVKGNCVVQRNDRPYCVCKPIKKCKVSKIKVKS